MCVHGVTSPISTNKNETPSSNFKTDLHKQLQPNGPHTKPNQCKSKQPRIHSKHMNIWPTSPKRTRIHGCMITARMHYLLKPFGTAPPQESYPNRKCENAVSEYAICCCSFDSELHQHIVYSLFPDIVDRLDARW